MTIDWWTLALQAVNFLILVWLLWRFLYRPVRDVIEKRKAMAERAFADADSKGAEAEAAEQRFEDARAQLAQERQEMLKRLHGELEDERAKVLEAAREEAQKTIEAARASIADEREATLADIRGQVEELAGELAASLLKSVGSAALDDIVLDQLEGKLKALPAEELRRLEADLAENDARLAVVTAKPLAQKDRKRWTERLQAALGSPVNVKFTADPEILGGAEVHFPHAVLKFTWADELRRAKAMIGTDDTAS
jgi:F-type H+-transporting ATPase subunit b